MISSTLKIHPNSLYRWIQEYEKYGLYNICSG
ncbi:helix-turn-helix domain-containing protein [Streptococcus pneumoniae]|nr:helix-turn-helix domain-containing protein [Streptococcus pneumoniae]